MSTAIDINTDLELLFIQDLNEEQECEHSRHHQDSPHWHEGKGEWYVDFYCSECGDNGILLFCDKWIKNRLSNAYPTRCTSCGHLSQDCREFYLRIWKKGE